MARARLNSVSGVTRCGSNPNMPGANGDCATIALPWYICRTYSPPSNASAGRAVLVFFYGGSWKYGSAMCPLYTGKTLSHHHDVITVALNYRLGVFGFSGSDRLRASDGSTGNFGIQDQRAGLAWVRRNAAALGADTSRVLIFGESAGAGSVANHLVRPRSWGLFSRAAMESGPIASWSSQTLADASARTGPPREGCRVAGRSLALRGGQASGTRRRALRGGGRSASG